MFILKVISIFGIAIVLASADRTPVHASPSGTLESTEHQASPALRNRFTSVGMALGGTCEADCGPVEDKRGRIIETMNINLKWDESGPYRIHDLKSMGHNQGFIKWLRSLPRDPSVAPDISARDGWVRGGEVHDCQQYTKVDGRAEIFHHDTFVNIRYAAIVDGNRRSISGRRVRSKEELLEEYDCVAKLYKKFLARFPSGNYQVVKSATMRKLQEKDELNRPEKCRQPVRPQEADRFEREPKSSFGKSGIGAFGDDWGYKSKMEKEYVYECDSNTCTTLKQSRFGSANAENYKGPNFCCAPDQGRGDDINRCVRPRCIKWVYKEHPLKTASNWIAVSKCTSEEICVVRRVPGDYYGEHICVGKVPESLLQDPSTKCGPHENTKSCAEAKNQHCEATREMNNKGWGGEKGNANGKGGWIGECGRQRQYQLAGHCKAHCRAYPGKAFLEVCYPSRPRQCELTDRNKFTSSNQQCHGTAAVHQCMSERAIIDWPNEDEHKKSLSVWQ